MRPGKQQGETKKWRKCMGIEPTGDARDAPPDGFEDRGHHQVCKHFRLLGARARPSLNPSLARHGFGGNTPGASGAKKKSFGRTRKNP